MIRIRLMVLIFAMIAIFAWGLRHSTNKLGGSKAEGITLGEVQEVTPADMKFGL